MSEEKETKEVKNRKGNTAGRAALGVAALLMVAVLAAAVVLLVQTGRARVAAQKEEEAMEGKMSGQSTFADSTDCDIYQDIPKMSGAGVSVGTAEDYGDKNYVLDVNGATLEEYQAYIQLLLESGFTKHSDHGEEGMEGLVYTTNLIREDLTLTVSHIVKMKKTYLSASNNLKLSEHLNYSEDYMADATDDAKTRLHMLELNNVGNSFVIELKNGHFIVEDGGEPSDTPYLLDYLESLTPGDEKPVVEAWFISHAHGDHYGVLETISNDKKYYERIYLDGIYFTSPSDEVTTAIAVGEVEWCLRSNWMLRNVNGVFTKENGEKADFHRMCLGQRYYFCDITIDVTITLEQFPQKIYDPDFNETSTWLMHNIEGQKVLINGDGYNTEMKAVMDIYDSSYFDLDVYSVSHHGINVENYFTDYITVDTLLYPSWRVGSIWWQESSMTEEDLAMVQNWSVNRSDVALWAEQIETNAYLQAKAKEAYSRGEGTLVLTFPYVVGTAETMEPTEWIYSSNYPYPERTWNTNKETN